MRYPRILLFLLIILTAALRATPARAAEIIPPSPKPHYIVDEAHVLPGSTLTAIDRQLEDFERTTSNQIVVAVYPHMQSDDSIAAYAVRMFQAWKIGQKSKNNGVLLLVFIDDRKMNITPGYGLEGALPDATCKAIIEKEIKPHFKTGDYDGGVRAGVNAIISATKGEYKGNNFTIGDAAFGFLICAFVIAAIVGCIVLQSYRGTIYNNRGNSLWWTLLWMMANSSSGSGSSGGWSSGGGGGFSGGGGSTGGGGASGSW